MESHDAKELDIRAGEPTYSNTRPATDTAVNRRVFGPAIGLLLSGSLCGLLAMLIVVQMALDLAYDSNLAIVPAQADGKTKVEADGKLMQDRDVLVLPPKGGRVSPDKRVEPRLHMVGQAPQITGLRALDIYVNLRGYACLLIYLLPVTFVLVYGALKMIRLKSYGASVLASVLAMLPITPGWCIGLPVGIWALVVLRDPEVRAAFRS